MVIILLCVARCCNEITSQLGQIKKPVAFYIALIDRYINI